MSTVPATPPLTWPTMPLPPVVNDVSRPPTNLVAEDGTNLESDWHRKQINLLIDSLGWRRRGRRDYYAGGNMFIYFNEEEARNRDFRGPAFSLSKESMAA